MPDLRGTTWTSNPEMLYTPRRATDADRAGIEVLVASAYEKYIARIGRKPKPMVADYRNALAKHEPIAGPWRQTE